MKLTRRQWGAALAGTAAAQVPSLAAGGQAQTAGQLEEAALDRSRRAAANLAKVKLPTATEPAFQFRP